jgi:hypothetical protein
MMSPNPMHNSPMAIPRVINAPVKASELLDTGVAPVAASVDEPDDPVEPVDPVEPDAPVAPAAVVVVPFPEVDADVVLVVAAVVLVVAAVVLVVAAVVLVVLVVPVPGTAVQTKPFGSEPLSVKVTWVFQ